MEGGLMDIALALEALVPAAIYRGSTSANTQEAYSAIEWEDERQQPTWQEIESKWAEIADTATTPLIDRLNVIFAAQPLELRAQFGPLRAAVKTAFDYEDIAAAQATIAGASIPQELEPVRAALLAEFN